MCIDFKENKSKNILWYKKDGGHIKYSLIIGILILVLLNGVYYKYKITFSNVANILVVVIDIMKDI